MAKMILEPDFLDHWKTRMLVDLLDNEAATNCILRLWFHCQTRRAVVFPGMNANALRAVCRWQGDAQKLMDAMSQCGFITVTDDGIEVPKWAEANSKMFSNWENGRRGGRPTQTEPKANPTITHQKPNGNPNNPTVTQTGIGVTQREPEGMEGMEGRSGREEGLEEYPPRPASPFEKPPKPLANVNPIARYPEPVQAASRDALDHWHFWAHGSLANVHNETTIKDLNRLAAAEESQPGTLVKRIKGFVAKPPPGWPRDSPLFKVLKHLGYDAPLASAPKIPQLPRQVLKDYTAERLAKEKDVA